LRKIAENCEKRLLASSCLSFRSHETTRLPMEENNEICYLIVFLQSVEKIKFLLKSDKNNGFFTWSPIYICLSYLAQIFLEWEIFPTKFIEKIQNTNSLFSNFLRKSCCLWDTVKKYYRTRQPTDDHIIRPMRMAC
jgi:CRISPR/Cas system endoribonuclease Cas6 (RAMP superfamily)